MPNKLRGLLWLTVIAAAGSVSWLVFAQTSADPLLWQHRNLGKAFYENPTTHAEAVAELKQALALAPNSPREQLNYALALLRQGENEAATAELLKVQKADPKLPHTWFNLGILYKKENEPEKAIAQFQEMVRLVPTEPVSHYQLGVLYKMKEDFPAAITQFETARDLS